ncbi:MAG: restriction endonuclease subunit S [Rhodanobacteraceae bacterium]
MKLETFFQKFEMFADAPNAVAKLRDLVLHMAVMGELVPQEGRGEPVRTLFKQIEMDRNNFAKRSKLSRQCTFDDISANEMPFALPRGWIWARLGALCRVQAGFAFSSTAFVQGNSGTPIIRIRDITNDRTQANYVGEYREEFMIQPGDYLVGMDGNFTVAKWRGPPALLNQRVSRLQWYSTELEPTFFAVAAQHRLSELQGKKAYTTVDHLSSKQIENVVVPIPPLAEQKRIVAKVDELMALCDRLEAQQRERETRHAALSRAALARFAETPTPANLELLFHESFAIPPADLRKSILTLAIQGKLVPQDSNDEPAQACFTRLGIKPTLLADDDGDLLPSSWRRVRFEDIAQTTGGVTLGRKLGEQKTVTLPYLRVANVKRGEIDLTVVKEVTIGKSEVDRYALRSNDLLMTEGGDWDKVGRAAIWGGQIPVCLHQNHVFRSRMRSEDISPLWCERYFNSVEGRRYFESASKQTTNLASINMRQVRACPVPFPPLAEQRRIVEKVDELMALVDKLEAQLATARASASALLDAAIADLTRSEQHAASAKPQLKVEEMAVV